MPKKLSLHEFISRSNKIHDGKYDYSRCVYKNTTTKVKIYCRLHNVWFWQTPKAHFISKGGCLECVNLKRKETCINTYGVDNPSKCNNIKQKKQDTCLKNHGVLHPLRSTIIQNKRKNTMVNKYGVANTLESEHFRKKLISGVEKKYNVDNPSKSPIVQAKRKNTMVNKYGREDFNQRHIPIETINIFNDIKWLNNEHVVLEKPLIQISKENNVGDVYAARKLKKCNITAKRFNSSYGEMTVRNFIKELGFEVVSNTQKILPGKYEIDIFIPKLNKGIEYNGLHWHKNRGINFHLWKTEESTKKSVSLMHVWEDQWENNQEQIKENIINFLSNVPQVPLTEIITIDLATDDPLIYIGIGYEILSQSPPEIYSEAVWDCGKIIT